MAARGRQVRLTLVSWLLRGDGYRGGHADLPQPWRVGETHAISQETATYLLAQHPTHFKPVED